MGSKLGRNLENSLWRPRTSFHLFFLLYFSFFPSSSSLLLLFSLSFSSNKRIFVCEQPLASNDFDFDGFSISHCLKNLLIFYLVMKILFFLGQMVNARIIASPTKSSSKTISFQIKLFFV